MRILRITLWSLALRGLIALALPAPAGSAVSASRPPPPLVLVESRPLETTLGDPSLPATAGEWLDMIGAARTTLDLEEYYLSERPGEALSPVLEAIGAAAARGVRVRLLLDAKMHRTYPMPADSLAKIPNVSVRVVDYGRLAKGVQHSKFMIADRSDAFVGSQNLDWRSLSHIHELGLRSRLAPVAAALEDVFETDWNMADTTNTTPPVDRARVKWPVRFEQGGTKGEIWLGASPRATTPVSIPWDRDLLVQRLDEARREIVVQTLNYGVAGFGSRDSTLHQALIAAARRGVKVRLLVSDWGLGYDGEADLKALATNANVEVRISRVPDWSGGYIPFARVEHCKFAVVDSSWLWLGTSNWEPSYFLTTRNVGLTVHHAGVASGVRGVFEKDWTSPTAVPFGPEAQLVSRPHGMKPPEGAKVYGE
jgi:phosphatidylserine/phosphatidylglycerophosphate/cardiolipin synthase-like enzyme